MVGGPNVNFWAQLGPKTQFSIFFNVIKYEGYKTQEIKNIFLKTRSWKTKANYGKQGKKQEETRVGVLDGSWSQLSRANKESEEPSVPNPNLSVYIMRIRRESKTAVILPYKRRGCCNRKKRI